MICKKQNIFFPIEEDDFFSIFITSYAQNVIRSTLSMNEVENVLDVKIKEFF
jgi:hypothetical protein